MRCTTASSTAPAWDSCPRRSSDRPASPHMRGFDFGCCSKVVATCQDTGLGLSQQPARQWRACGGVLVPCPVVGTGVGVGTVVVAGSGDVRYLHLLH